MTLGIVVGLEAEGRIARGLAGPVAAGGGTPAGAAAAAERLVAGGATALLSFGLAGGLDPALAPGTLVVPGAVLHRGRPWPCDPALTSGVPAAAIATLIAPDAIVATAAAKAALFHATGAAAVDLESGAVAEAAARHGVPFAVLRAICDPAGRDLPPAALTALDAAGRIAPARLAASLLRHPSQIAGLIALGRDAARARRSLLGVRL